MRRLRLYAAGLVAFLIGLPLTAKVFGQEGTVGEEVGDVIDTATGTTTTVS